MTSKQDCYKGSGIRRMTKKVLFEENEGAAPGLTGGLRALQAVPGTPGLDAVFRKAEVGTEEGGAEPGQPACLLPSSSSCLCFW